ncbi:hypothetical protein [Streptomyces sp. DG1A-41]|uniref:hypothetical protein n=1 Tax=Streptomyces sp. DG1A-41 TaxID=3125779 RepID=UPI0030CE8F1B
MNLPDRPGHAPRTRGPVPHGQLDQVAPTPLQEELWQRMRSLSGVHPAPAHVPYPEARAIHLAPEFGTGPDDAFIRNSREFAPTSTRPRTGARTSPCPRKPRSW